MPKLRKKNIVPEYLFPLKEQAIRTVQAKERKLEYIRRLAKRFSQSTISNQSAFSSEITFPSKVLVSPPSSPLPDDLPVDIPPLLSPLPLSPVSSSPPSPLIPSSPPQIDEKINLPFRSLSFSHCSSSANWTINKMAELALVQPNVDMWLEEAQKAAAALRPPNLPPYVRLRYRLKIENGTSVRIWLPRSKYI